MSINIKSQTELSGYYIVFRGSSDIETPGQRGSSHLMEHIICNSYKSIEKDMQRDGIYVNASTYDNFVVFYIQGLQEYLNKYIDKYTKFILGANITDKILEKERKIVLQEYYDNFNKQDTAHVLNLNRKLFDYYDPIGEESDIKNITLDQCRKIQKERFTTPYKIINVSHDDSHYKNVHTEDKRILNRFKYLKNNKYIHQTSNIFKEKTSIVMYSPIIRSDYPVIDFISSMLGDGLESPLYKEIREKSNLVYYVYSYTNYLSLNDMFYGFATQTSNSNTQKVIDLAKKVIGNPKKYMTKERFDICKNSQIITYKKNRIEEYKQALRYMYPNEHRLELIIENLTYEKVMEVYNKHFNIDKFYISRDDTEFIK